jgi:hypothetical protein
MELAQNTKKAIPPPARATTSDKPSALIGVTANVR